MATTTQLRRRECSQGMDSESANVVLYHSDKPIVSVERGTTFGLIKMLYESIGGGGKIIGLRQRQNTSSLAFIITQEQTNLTEQEYDIILHGGNKTTEINLETKASNKHDKEINTYISLRPDQVWYPWADSFSASTRRPWQKDDVNRVETTTKNSIYLSEQIDKQCKNIESLPDHFNVQMRQKFVPVESTFEYMANRKEMRIDYTTRDESTEEKRVVFPRDSTSPSTASIESPGRSSQNSPHQAEQPRPLKRKLQCFYCKKFFVCRSAYNNHERTHTGEKPFQCSVCGRSFGHQGNLKQHMHIHREVKPHVCDICGRGFTRSNRLRDHKRSHQYELFMQTKVQWTKTQKAPTDNHAENIPIVSQTFEESVTSDENQDTS